MVDLDWVVVNFPEIRNPARLGKGGQKEVFAGTHDADGDVVLKIFHPGADVERQLREVRAPQDISSQRIPRIYDSGTTDSPLGAVLWVREQLIHGQSLREMVLLGPLGDADVLRLGLHIAEALAAAEIARIVHRDVKPDNILVADDGAYWLLDFGYARHLDLVSITATARMFGVGTPGYAPPEQLFNRKSDIDCRADLFGLGATLYECIEGVNPLREGARDVTEIIRRTESVAIPPIQRQVEHSGELRALVQAMTRIRREHRPSTAAAAYEWMREICAREGVG